LAPSEQSILADTFEPKKRGQAFAVYGLAVVCAPVIGPTLGGWITDNFDWRWIFFINVPIAMLSLFLTNRVVEDPPHIQQQVKEIKKKGLNLDFFGFGLLAVGFGTLEFILDKAQEDDWFGSRLITSFVVICVASLLTLIVWEIWQIRHKHKPILDLTLFRHRNFAISFVLMFVLGFSLYATTVLLPQFVQSLLGYTAEDAGMVLSPGGLMVMVLMPLVGYMVSKVDPRWMVVYGFAITSISLNFILSLNLSSSYTHIATLRIFQASGLAFLFVPINTLSYSGVPSGKFNDISGLTNLARNIGGSTGTAFLVTMLARRAQLHQDRLASHIVPGGANTQTWLDSMRDYLLHHGAHIANNGTARVAAQGRLYQMMLVQAQLLSYMDVVRFLSIFTACMIPVIFLLKKPKQGAGPGGMH